MFTAGGGGGGRTWEHTRITFSQFFMKGEQIMEGLPMTQYSALGGGGGRRARHASSVVQRRSAPFTNATHTGIACSAVACSCHTVMRPRGIRASASWHAGWRRVWPLPSGDAQRPNAAWPHGSVAGARRHATARHALSSGAGHGWYGADKGHHRRPTRKATRNSPCAQQTDHKLPQTVRQEQGPDIHSHTHTPNCETQHNNSG